LIVLARSEEEGIVVEELDQIQVDVETLLAAVGLRLKQLSFLNKIMYSLYIIYNLIFFIRSQIDQ
jgi:hypothetical protein